MVQSRNRWIHGLSWEEERTVSSAAPETHRASVTFALWCRLVIWRPHAPFVAGMCGRSAAGSIMGRLRSGVSPGVGRPHVRKVDKPRVYRVYRSINQRYNRSLRGRFSAHFRPAGRLPIRQQHVGITAKLPDTARFPESPFLSGAEASPGDTAPRGKCDAFHNLHSRDSHELQRTAQLDERGRVSRVLGSTRQAT